MTDNRVNLKKIKALHIHTDLKFIGETSIFEGPYFNNQIIYLGDSKSYQGPFEDKLIYNKRNYFGLKKLIRICNSSDIVVLYDLDPIKSAIANSVSENIKIAWRFFGYELYKRKKELYVSRTSLETVTESGKLDFINDLVSFSVFSSLKPVNLFFDSSFDRAVSRIDFFLCLSRMEYTELSKEWPGLPPCIEIPFWGEIGDLKPQELWEMKEPTIILGNNKSIYNNHLDLFKELENSSKVSEYNFIIPFSYGAENEYTNAVRLKVKEQSRYSLLEDFLPYKNYNEIIRQTSALIINSYRQIGMDTIFMALAGGVKVYLNSKNITYPWLKSRGFKIFDINSIGEDLGNHDVKLSVLEIECNIQALRELKESYPKTEFQRNLVEKF